MPFVEEYHGTDGPIHTSFNDWRVPFENGFMHTCDEIAGMKERPKVFGVVSILASTLGWIQ